jgi:hypothetical protein
LLVEKRDQTYIYTPTLTESEFISWLVSHILEDLFVSFAGPTQTEIERLSDPAASARASQLLEEITRRRAEEEGH